MIFVITTGGRSHCPDEAADILDCAAGVGVLADVLYERAY
jgi:acetylornithine deacetylase/succinyl-diaminopimelate desuccinylase-like protein